MPNWNDVLREITDYKAEHSRQAQAAVDAVRRKYLDLLFQHSGRNTIAYYSGFLSKPNLDGIEITDEDKNGFMMAVHGLDRSRGLDLIIHTPGGGIAATQSLVDYLRRMFGKNIRAVIPQIAMSAGTMMACACREILLTRHANIGPIDPQLRGVPAHGVIQEFRRAAREIKKDSTKLGVWQPILSKYQPTFLSQCENAIKWSESFVAAELKAVMFEGDSDAAIKAKKIVKALSSYQTNKAHSRHLHYDEAQRMGLRVSLVESNQEFQDLLLTVHHCYMHSLMNTSAFKMIENHRGAAFVKHAQMQAIPGVQ